MDTILNQYGPWALITGASSGIGEEFSHQLAKAGFNLILTARRIERLDSLASQLQENHAIQVTTIAADLAKKEDIHTLIQKTAHYDIGLLVNNAGFSMLSYFLDMDIDRASEMLSVNCQSPMLLTYHIGQKMRKKGKGAVVFVSSITAMIPSPPWSNYVATKSYTLTLGKCLSLEFKQYGIDLQILCPGGTQTEFQETANMDSHKGGFLSKFVVTDMTPIQVVNASLHNLGRKTIVIPGIKNRVLSTLVSLSPWKIAMNITAWVLDKTRKE